MRSSVLRVIRQLSVFFLIINFLNGNYSLASSRIDIEEVKPLIHVGDLAFEVTRRPGRKRELEIRVHGTSENYAVYASIAEALITSLQSLNGGLRVRPFVSTVVFGKELQKETDLFGRGFNPEGELWERPFITPIWSGRVSIGSRRVVREFASRVLYGADAFENPKNSWLQNNFSVGLVEIIRYRIRRVLLSKKYLDSGKMLWLGFVKLQAGRGDTLKSLETEMRFLIFGNVKDVEKGKWGVTKLKISIFLLPASSVGLVTLMNSHSSQAMERMGAVVDAAASLLDALLNEGTTVPVVAVGGPLQVSPALCQLSLASELLASVPVFRRPGVGHQVKCNFFEELFSDRGGEEETSKVPDWNNWESVETSLKEAVRKKKLNCFLKMLLRNGPFGNLLELVADFYREASLWVAGDDEEGVIRYVGKV